MVTRQEYIQNYASKQELAQWVATLLHSGKLNPDVDYEDATNWVKIMHWLEEPIDV